MFTYENLSVLMQAGAIGLAFAGLWFGWTSLKDKKNVTANRISLIRSMMIFSVILVVLGVATEGVRLYFKYLNDSEHTVIALKESFTDILTNYIYEPQLSSNGTYKYLRRAPGGLLAEVNTETTFQNFTTEHLVQRFWYDAQSSRSYISAYKEQNGSAGSLVVTFARDDGWGCDVTIKGQRMQVVYTGEMDRLILSLSLDEKTKAAITENNFPQVGFRLRVVDGRSNHWAWGDTEAKSGKESANYSDEDSNGRKMIVDSTSSMPFEFDIKSRNNWGIFRSDGSYAPIQDKSERFRFIQFVVLEFGFNPNKKKGVVTEDSSDPNRHDRKLIPSPELPTGKLFDATVRVSSIHFSG